MFSPWSEREVGRMLGVFALGTASVGVFVLALLYLLYGVHREDTWRLGAAVALCVPGYLIASRTLSRAVGFSLGLGLRLAALFAFPLLSDDIYRFLWDGELWWAGLHPLAATPEVLAKAGAGAAFAKTHATLLVQMNSASYFTIYPTLSQLGFAWSTCWTDDPYWGSVSLKSLLLLGELGVWWLLPKLISDLEHSNARALLYWLNPLIIIELVGNAHFEGLGLLGILLALWSLRRAGIGWARQGWVAVVERNEKRRRRARSFLHVYVGLGLSASEHLQAAQAKSHWRWILLGAIALAGATLVKLVPLILAPAFTLAALWQWSRQMRYDETYYAMLPITVRRVLDIAASANSISAAANYAKPMSQHRDDEYTLAGAWPYGHAYEVVPPSAPELTEMRAELQARRAMAEESKREHLAPTPRSLSSLESAQRFGQAVPFPPLQGERIWQWRRAFLFAVTLLLFTGLGLSLMFTGSDLSGFGESLDLYFRKFEFNGSLYTLVNGLGSLYKGWNWIAIIGPSMGLLGSISLVGIAAYRNWRGLDLAETLLWCLTVYLACATTVHPWYFVTLIGLGAVTRYWWPMVLGCTAFLSYAAYAKTPAAVPVWALVLEYGLPLCVAVYELRGRFSMARPAAGRSRQILS